LLLPETDEEIIAVEHELQSEGGIKVPAGLLEPLDFASAPRFSIRKKSAPADAAVEEELARAARSGGDIPRHIEEQMARDREAAEKKGDDDEEQ